MYWQSGNPAGRPRGSRHKATAAVAALLEGQAETLTERLIAEAKAATRRRCACTSTAWRHGPRGGRLPSRCPGLPATLTSWRLPPGSLP